MVVVNTEQIHCPSLLGTVNELRKEGGVCNAFLVVNGQKIPAHRCILVAASDYFRSRFMGPLCEDSSDVDLSTITDDVASVENVVNYLYTGRIEIDSENIESLLKVASYLLLSDLKQHCIDFIENTLSSDTAIKYYLIAFDQMLDDLEKKLKQTLKSRFHDWIIFEKSTLEISPEHLQFLIKECNIFQFCSVGDILVFVNDWVKTGQSLAHKLLGCKILDTLSSVNTQVETITDSPEKATDYEKLKQILVNEQGDTKFSKKLIEVSQKHINEDTNDFEKSNPNDMQPDEPEMLSKAKESVQVTEMAIIVASPNKRMVSEFNSDDNFTLKKKDAIFDITVYVPRTRTWYYVRKGFFKGILEDILTLDNELNWNYFGMLDQVCCFCPGIDNLEILQLYNKPNKNKNIRLDMLSLEMDEEEESHDLWCVISDDNCLYLIVRNTLLSCLNCFKLGSNDLWKMMFCTPGTDNKRGYSGSMAGHVSSVSNEMMLLCVIPTEKSGPRKQLHVFVSDLEGDTITSRAAKELSAGLHSSYSWQIIEKGEFMYLMEVNGDNTTITARYRYKLGSKVLESCNKSVTVADETFPHVSDCEVAQLQYDASANDGKSVWFFAGNKHNGSSLSEVCFDSEGKLSLRTHAPPPFSCATIFAAGKVSSETLSKARVITRYLDG